MNHPVGILHAEDQEEFEAWERSEVKRREQESNEAVKALREKDGRTYPGYDEQNSNHLNNPDLGYQY